MIFQHVGGQLPAAIWDGWVGEMMLVFGTPGGRDAIAALKGNFLSAEFVNFIETRIDSLEGESPITSLRASWDRIAQERRARETTLNP